MNLLIVNDEKITARTMKKEIAWGNYEIEQVFLAFDADEAKEQIKMENIDIILCDIEMPGDNGISLLRWIREENRDIDCIFLTCHANFSYAQDAVKLNCVDYVLLPAPYEVIGESVRKVVERRKNRKEGELLQQYGRQWISQKSQELLREQGEKKSHEQIVEECETYILNNLGNLDLSVNEVAASCHLNPVYLNRIFKKKRGISISQFIIKEKMDLAARLLKSGQFTANAVALKVGYPSYPYFSSMFKKYYGCSPKQFKDM